MSAPRRVARYEIVREIGRGATAIVYLARQTDLDRHVALKELAGFHAADPAFVERFLRESRLAGSLNHPNIVTVHEYFEHDGTAYIAMEYLERGSLRPFVGSLRLPQVAGVLEGLLAGLEHAEARGIVHRDLKPENVMVSSSGAVKIADFGVAKALQANGAAPLTLSGTTVGTPAYMAPEQALAGSVGHATDLYAVGVIAYELLTGEVPYRDSDVALGILLQHLNDPVPSPRLVTPELDAALSEWVERMLAKQPGARPASAADAWDALDEIVVGLLGARWGRQSRLTEPRRSASPASARPTPATSGLAPDVRHRRRRRWLVLVAAGLALVALAAGAVTAAIVTDESPTTAPTSSETAGAGDTTDRTPPPAPAAPTVTGIQARDRGENVLLALTTSGASLPRRPVVLRDADLSDGLAWFEVRGPGITTTTRRTRVGPLSVLIRKARNRLRVDLAAESGSLSTLTVAPAGAHRVTITIAKPGPPPQASPPPPASPAPPPPPAVTEPSDRTPTEPPKKPAEKPPPIKTG